MTRAAVIAQGDTILLKDLPPEIQEWAKENPAEAAEPTESATAAGQALSAGASPEPAASPAESGPMANLKACFENLYTELRRENREDILSIIEKAMIEKALRETGGNQVKASSILGITRATLRKRIDQYAEEKAEAQSEP